MCFNKLINISRHFSEITDPKNHRAKRNAPDVIYPEFIIVIDYRLYK